MARVLIAGALCVRRSHLRVFDVRGLLSINRRIPISAKRPSTTPGISILRWGLVGPICLCRGSPCCLRDSAYAAAELEAVLPSVDRGVDWREHPQRQGTDRCRFDPSAVPCCFTGQLLLTVPPAGTLLIGRRLACLGDRPTTSSQRLSLRDPPPDRLLKSDLGPQLRC